MPEQCSQGEGKHGKWVVPTRWLVRVAQSVVACKGRVKRGGVQVVGRDERHDEQDCHG